MLSQSLELLEHTVAVVSAGTSDMLLKAALTAEFYGNNVQRIYDVGVAGMHRLLARLGDLRSAGVLIVVNWHGGCSAKRGQRI